MSESVPAGTNYKDTLNLPKTAFEMKANLTQREPAMLAAWQKEGLYKQVRGRAHPQGKWVLHDGPPYANGDIHMGHLINKVLKDMVVKFRTMQGFDSPFVPGWDCHGLPIESAIQKELGPKFRELSKEELRKKCAAYAMKYVKLQGDSFQRLGVFGEFENPYLTLNPKYEAGILDVLGELVEKALVYRQKKPVHWCTFDRTALAEAELEYASKRDTSVYVEFNAITGSLFFNSALKKMQGRMPGDVSGRLKLMIWTTTPWTLPANRAVAVKSDAEYVAVGYGHGESARVSIIAKALVERVMTNGKVGDYVIGDDVWTGGEIARTLQYEHPLNADSKSAANVGALCPVVVADYVTLEDGTGLVHTAPGHGKEDYQTGIKYGLEVYNPVLPDGRYDDTVPEFLRGKTIWEANAMVVEKLRELGTLFHAQEFDHEYPHCWRCKKPVIFRATEQWFVKAGAPDGNPVVAPHQSDQTLMPRTSTGLPPGAPSPLWTNAKSFVNDVKWIPAWGKNRIDGMLDTRPDWCISRQRSWGVPIPAFFDDKGRTLLTTQSVARIAAYFAENGADSWYTHTPAQLLSIDPADLAQGLQSLGFAADVDVSKLDKGQDILDVWFESGASHHAVLERTHPELGYPAQMYLEGSDQHRGWFQSSLLEASGYKSEPPFREVLTHGFVVDEKGRKMSKSEGNDIKVTDALKQYGADVLRLWVCSVDYQNDIPCGPNLLAKTGEAYRKVRNTIRYLLGNLYDFNPQTDAVEPLAHSIDQWMQHRVDTWAQEVFTAYDTYEFHNVFKKVYEFCNVEISAVYAKAIKDRLYCELPASVKRRSSQTVCYRALVRLVELMAPVLAFTAEESWAAIRTLPGGEQLVASVHLRELCTMEAAVESVAIAHWSTLMPLIEKGNKQLDELKKSVGLGNALDAEAVIIVPAGAAGGEIATLMNAYGPEVEDALGVGFHRIEQGDSWDIRIEDTREKYASCARSWKRRPDVGLVPEFPDLSRRDAEVVRIRRQA